MMIDLKRSRVHISSFLSIKIMGNVRAGTNLMLTLTHPMFFREQKHSKRERGIRQRVQEVPRAKRKSMKLQKTSSVPFADNHLFVFLLAS
jgi:hypothetical protein